MESLRDKVLCASLGAAGGLAGFLPFAACAGVSCSACPGCAGMAASLILVLLAGRLKKGRKKNGLA